MRLFPDPYQGPNPCVHVPYRGSGNETNPKVIVLGIVPVSNLEKFIYILQRMLHHLFGPQYPIIDDLRM